MKKFILLALFIGTMLLFGCNPTGESATTLEVSAPVPTAILRITSTLLPVSSTPIPSSPTPSITMTETGSPTSTGTPSPTPTLSFFPETNLQLQCIEVVPTLPNAASSSGIVILDSRVTDADGLLEPGTFLIDMKTGNTSQIALSDERQVGHIVSPDKKLMAYESVIFNTADQLVQDELVIATATGERLAAIPWEKGWGAMPAWLGNQQVILNLSGLDPEENTSRKPATMLVLNPFTGERQILEPDFPQYILESWTKIPWWEGWSGVVYNAPITRALYPRLVAGTEDPNTLFTYALWDLTNNQLVASLEDSFIFYDLYTDFPTPRWSLDGTEVVFRNVILVSDEAADFELMRVNEDGQTEQLTHLTSVAVVQDSNLSWSPDGRYIAMFLNYWKDRQANSLEEKSHVAVLDTETLKVTDYCISFPRNKGVPPSAIWSPDSTQFLVVDRYDENHQRVILVDIVQGFAVQIAEDMEPMGWMLAP